MMNDIFQEYLDHFVVIYLDDILVFLPTGRSTHHIRMVLAQSEKCELDRTYVEFLGYNG